MASVSSSHASARVINLALILGASGIRGIGQWLFVFILIRVSGPESVGVYGYATALVTPVVALTGLQLPRVIATEKIGQRSLGSYVAVRLLATGLNAIVLIPLVLVLSRDSLWPVAALVLQTGALGLVEVYQASMLQQSRLRMYGVVNVVTQAVAWFGAAVVLYTTEDMALALAASGIGILASYAIIHLGLRTMGLPRIHPSFFGLRPIVWENFPLGLALLVDALMTHSPRFLLERFHGKYELGILVGLLTFLSASTLITESVAQAGTPWITRLVHSGQSRSFARFMRGLTIITISLCVGVPSVAWLIGPPMAGVLLEPIYSEYSMALVGVGFIAALQLTTRVATISMNAAKLMKWMLYVSTAALIVTLGCGFALIPAYGINGAMLALAAGSLVKWSVVRLILQHILNDMKN